MSTIVFVVNVVSILLYVALVTRAVSSWLNIDPSSPFYPIVRLAYQITEPILAPIRRVLPKGAMDFSPMVAIIIVAVIERVLRGALGS